MKKFHIDFNDSEIQSVTFAVSSPIRRSIFVGSVITREYYLPFPYILFCQIISDGHGYLQVGFAQDTIKLLEDVIYLPPLPNIFVRRWIGYFVVCLGQVTNFDHAIERFWTTKFITSLAWAGAKALPRVFGSYEEWSKLSIEETIKRLPRSPYDCTVGEFLLGSKVKGSFDEFIRSRTI
jgi:hypothetical protein